MQPFGSCIINQEIKTSRLYLGTGLSHNYVLLFWTRYFDHKPVRLHWCNPTELSPAWMEMTFGAIQIGLIGSWDPKVAFRAQDRIDGTASRQRELYIVDAESSVSLISLQPSPSSDIMVFASSVVHVSRFRRRICWWTRSMINDSCKKLKERINRQRKATSCPTIISFFNCTQSCYSYTVWITRAGSSVLILFPRRWALSGIQIIVPVCRLGWCMSSPTLKEWRDKLIVQALPAWPW